MINIRRPTLFYDQYQWCARFHMPECHALRRLEHRWIDRTLAQRRRWGRKLVKHTVGSWQAAWESLEITAEMESDLHVLCDFLLADNTPRRIRIQEDHMSVYSNDPALFDRIQSLAVCESRERIKVELVDAPGTVNLRSSDHALRTFLRAHRLSEHTAGSLRAFFHAQTDIRLSPSLAAWCANNWLWTQRHFFFDHHSASTANMLALIAPGLVKRTLTITTDK
jgi:hypothetical protein